MKEDEKNNESITTILRPLTIKESEFFLVEMCNFFSPSLKEKYAKIIEKEVQEKVITPFSFFDFLKYLEKHRKIESFRFYKKLEVLINKAVNEGLLSNAGTTFSGSPPLNKTYYAINTVTKIQEKNLFWLSRVLGASYINYKYKEFIVRIEGINREGVSGTGSGILINENTILTCGHNIKDLFELNCFINEEQFSIGDKKYHDKFDIGIIKLNQKVERGSFPYFGEPYILDKIVTMGYPPVSYMQGASLITQTGEINSIEKDYNSCECITISSITRPGNSGGPVVSEQGYIVGIVAQQSNMAESISSEEEKINEYKAIPFYNAVASTQILKIIKDLDENIDLLFEDYK